eukprot:TRINITY_DN1415_c0_g1_i1.p1 TRINITY_DN1415_c0_g1~~TRINITY_DN1415_c0_g1_i1.p1  ORF type:complete len:249 (-),score=79.23 TRINITY_DN1415_c0_g1_i1:31-777(-)
MKDPFVLIGGKVEDSMKVVENHYDQWFKIYNDMNPKKNLQDFEYRTNELKLLIEEVQDDIDELYETIEPVEANPKQWNLTHEDVKNRKNFLYAVQNRLKKITNDLNSNQTKGRIEKDKKELLMKNKNPVNDKHQQWKEAIEGDNQQYIQVQQQRQREIMDNQDKNLELLGQGVTRVGEMAITINEEIKDQDKLIGEVEEDMDKTMVNMQKAIRKLDKLIEKAGDGGVICIIVVLVLILVGLVVLIFTI